MMGALLLICCSVAGVQQSPNDNWQSRYIRDVPTFTGDQWTHFFNIGDQVTINLDTGEVTLNGDPNEAARILWEAVDRYGRGIVSENKRLREKCREKP